MKLLAAGLSDVGRRRAQNEDSYLVDQDLGLLIVADGLGGHCDGKVASALAVEAVRKALSRQASSGAMSPGQLSQALVTAVEEANKDVYEASFRRRQGKRMATTVAVAWRVGENIVLAHVGDSRIYLLRQGRLSQLTDDHSLVMEQHRQGLIPLEETGSSPQRNILTRALGMEAEIKVEVSHLSLQGGDRLLLCSDGLTSVVPEEALTTMITACSQPAALCRRLVDLANHGGGDDNITVLAAYNSRTYWEYIWVKLLMQFGG